LEETKLQALEWDDEPIEDEQDKKKVMAKAMLEKIQRTLFDDPEMVKRIGELIDSSQSQPNSPPQLKTEEEGSEKLTSSEEDELSIHLGRADISSHEVHGTVQIPFSKSGSNSSQHSAGISTVTGDSPMSVGKEPVSPIPPAEIAARPLFLSSEGNLEIGADLIIPPALAGLDPEQMPDPTPAGILAPDQPSPNPPEEPDTPPFYPLRDAQPPL
jgi:hypothetical protein